MIIHFTHNDADALGCMLHVQYKFSNQKIQTFHTNYRDIEEQVSNIYDFIEDNDVQLLIITDISFSGNKDQLQKLIALNIKTIFIDHHEYPDGFFNIFKDTQVIYRHDIDKAATGICQDFFKCTHAELNNLSNIINTYDIWLQQEKLFYISLIFNEYFWNYVSTHTISELSEKIQNNNYKLPSDFLNFVKEYKINSKKAIQNFKDRKLITSDGFFCVAFVDEYFNEILYEEFSKGTEFVFIANSYGITRFRFNAYGTLTRTQKETIKEKLIGTLENGHLNAFSAKIQNSNFEKIMDRVQAVYKILQPYKGQK